MDSHSHYTITRLKMIGILLVSAMVSFCSGGDGQKSGRMRRAAGRDWLHACLTLEVMPKLQPQIAVMV
ncbi:hypothetical protein OIU79_027962 [Salix purpurea]|uniref:Uncharacterized protein n=1 Tax=Salix purpurea TaxID=77065 RepID=A0A9Q1A266_SALPP|nr:hypothetical protein OIU79_027962 [Salix purpurea]